MPNSCTYLSFVLPKHNNVKPLHPLTLIFWISYPFFSRKTARFTSSKSSFVHHCSISSGVLTKRLEISLHGLGHQIKNADRRARCKCLETACVVVKALTFFFHWMYSLSLSESSSKMSSNRSMFYYKLITINFMQQLKCQI